MKYLLLLLAVSGCATTSSSLTSDRPDIRDYCGEVGKLSVYADRWNGFVDCQKALLQTQEAYILLQAKVGNLNEPWDIEYTYKYLQFVDFDFKTPYEPGPRGTLPKGPHPLETIGITYPLEHVIKIRERRPHAIFHEMMHAYIHENSLSAGNSHKVICQHHDWWKAESDYISYPYYCYDNGGVK